MCGLFMTSSLGMSIGACVLQDNNVLQSPENKWIDRSRVHHTDLLVADRLANPEDQRIKGQQRLKPSG